VKKKSTAAKRATVRRLSLAIAEGKPLAQSERIFVWDILDRVAENGLPGFLPKESVSAKRGEGHKLAVAYLYHASLQLAPIAHGEYDGRKGTLAEKLDLAMKTVSRALEAEGDFAEYRVILANKNPGGLRRECEALSKLLGPHGPATLVWLDSLAAEKHKRPPSAAK
jgi:hypothetical protein